MPVIRSTQYNHREVAAITIDTNSGQYVWIAFRKDSQGNCRILKVSANDLNQIYFDFNLAVEAVKTLCVRNSYLLVGIDHATNYLCRVPVSNPMASQTFIERPSDINEAPIAVADDGNDLWWLFPGELSETAKIVKTTYQGSYEETIEIQENNLPIHKARSLVCRNGDIWVVTYESPLKLVRVYQDSDTWTVKSTQIAS